MKRINTYCVPDDTAAYTWASEQPVSFNQNGYYYFSAADNVSTVSLNFFDYASSTSSVVSNLDTPYQTCSLTDDLADTTLISTGLILMFVIAFAFKAKIKALG